jgi:hypothetical protein
MMKRADFAAYKGQGRTPKVYCVHVGFRAMTPAGHILDDELYTNRAEAEKRFTEVKRQLAENGFSWYLGQKATCVCNPTVDIYVSWDWQDHNGKREIDRTRPCTFSDIVQKWTTCTPWMN